MTVPPVAHTLHRLQAQFRAPPEAAHTPGLPTRAVGQRPPPGAPSASAMPRMPRRPEWQVPAHSPAVPEFEARAVQGSPTAQAPQQPGGLAVCAEVAGR